MNSTPSNENGLDSGEQLDTTPSENYHHTEISATYEPQGITGGLDITGEPVLVRAAFLYLSRKGAILWMDWLIGNVEQRLKAARWLAKQYDELNTILQRENP
jgi:hypothetical protein